MSNFDFPILSNLLQPALLAVGISILIVLLYLALLLQKYNRRNNTDDKFEEIYAKIKEDIKYSVAPKSLELSLGVKDLVELATEVWRIEQRLAKSISTLPENQRKGLEHSVQTLKRYLEKYDIEIVDYTNQKFNDGLTLEILSVEKDPSLREPIVKETIEPTIMCKGQVVRKAKIVLLTNK